MDTKYNYIHLHNLFRSKPHSENVSNYIEIEIDIKLNI